jgi:hypothetical protein
MSESLFPASTEEAMSTPAIELESSQYSPESSEDPPPARRRSSIAPRTPINTDSNLDPYHLIDSSVIRDIQLSDLNDSSIDNANKWFSNIIALQKSAGDMFLFGSITANMFEAIQRIYHENLARLAGGTFLPPTTKFYGFMLGILQAHDGSLYMTISEDPTEDTDFKNKIQTLYKILLNANFDVNVPEDKMQEYLRSTLNYKLDPKQTNTYTTKADEELKDKNIHRFSEYSRIKANKSKIQVYLINSEDYLSQRKSGMAYPPAKKLKYNKSTKEFVHECNNGSTCVEAKLFSYYYQKFPEKRFEDIVGFTAYWVAGELPPNHYMAKYSYCRTSERNKACETQDETKLNKMTKDILTSLWKDSEAIIAIEASGDFEKYKTILQPLALSCPGCLLNWSNYRNNRKHSFNYSTCNPNAMTHDEMKSYYQITGGSYKSKLRKNIRNKRSKKRKNTKKKNKYTFRIRNKINYKTKKIKEIKENIKSIL